MVSKIKYEMSTLFLTGLVFSFLSHISDVLKENPYEGVSKLRIFLILLTRSILGGITAVIIYYGLFYYYPEMASELRVGLSSAGAFFSEQLSLLVIALVKRKTQ